MDDVNIFESKLHELLQRKENELHAAINSAVDNTHEAGVGAGAGDTDDAPATKVRRKRVSTKTQHAHEQDT